MLSEPVAMTPQTPGWWVLAGIALCLAVFGGLRFADRWRANAYRRAALRALARVGDRPAEVSAILKRAALAGFDRSRVAALSGDDWLEFLKSTGGHGFGQDTDQWQRTSPYSETGNIPVAGLNDAARQWVKHHRRPRGQASD